MRIRIFRWIKFVSIDMWRMTDEDLNKSQGFFFNALKALIMTGKSYVNENLGREASALTYSTVLSIVPLLAVIVGIAKGFGLQEIIYRALLEYLPSHQHELEMAFQSVENYFAQIRGGLFLGLGLIILLYTVINLIAVVEETFNKIWQAQKRRTWGSKIVNYLAFMILLPLLIIVSSGLTIMMGTFNNTFFSDYIFIQPFLNNLLNLAPYVMVIIGFTVMYMVLPFVRVRFLPALISGTLSGIAFQIFQFLYINGVMWISKYNAIYGSFAVFPLLLLWINLSWTITLFGAQLCFSIQNIDNFAFEKETKNISRRYFDFILIVMMSSIVKRFVNGGERSLSRADKLANECCIPIKLANKAIHVLLKVGAIIQVNYGENEERYYLPALDSSKLTVGLLLTMVDKSGTEDFLVDKTVSFKSHWEAMKASRLSLENMDTNVLLSEL
ncbi:YihY/virulence factor BrkB family protein [Porphyromonas macacae]|nr:YihY/virulence factor BrkB family protein [Porphyromonas macacae]